MHLHLHNVLTKKYKSFWQGRPNSPGRSGYATAAATQAAEAVAISAQADAKLRDAQVYMANHHYNGVWDSHTGTWATRKGKGVTQQLGGVLEPERSSHRVVQRHDHGDGKALSYSGSRVLLADHQPAPGLTAETTIGLHGADKPSRGGKAFSGVGHQTAATGAPQRSC